MLLGSRIISIGSIRIASPCVIRCAIYETANEARNDGDSPSGATSEQLQNHGFNSSVLCL